MTKSLNDKVERICAIGVCVLTVVIMFWLWVESIVWTQTFWSEIEMDYTDAFMPRIRDGIKGNILFCILLSIVLAGICLGVKKWIKQWHITVILVVEAVAMIVFSWIYLCELRAVQWADFGQIINIANEFVNGDYSQFEAGNYLATYPHQLGLVCFMTGIIKLVGAGNAVSVFQFLNCLCVGGILVGGYCAVRNIWDKKETDIVYLLMQGLCLPLYFYTPLVYGEIISTMFLMFGIAQMVKMLRQQRLACLRVVAMLVCTGLAVCFRKNSLIILIAMGIVILITLFKEKCPKIGVLLIVLVICASLPTVLQKATYGKYDENAAMPAVMWIYIGIQEGSGFGCGAYDGKAGNLFREAGYNPELAADMAEEVIADRINYFIGNPKGALAFYKEKILWQWEDPTYMSFSNTRFKQEGYPIGIANEINYGKLREPVNEFMDAYQSFVYLFLMVGVVGMMKEKEHFSGFLWAIIFLGGFVFSILWEAKTRYTYPYFIMMIPICAYGVYFFSDCLRKAVAAVVDRIKRIV